MHKETQANKNNAVKVLQKISSELEEAVEESNNVSKINVHIKQREGPWM